MVSQPKQIVVEFTPSSYDGGNAVAYYTYSTDNITYNVVPTTGTPYTFTITNLDRTTSYFVYMKAWNARGNSFAAQSSVSVVPYTIPDNPVIAYLTPSSNRIIVGIIPQSDGGSALISYSYSYDNGSNYINILPSSIVNNEFTITGLTNGQNYFVRLYATNARGVSSIVQSSYSETPFSNITITPSFLYRNTPTTISYTNDNTTFASEIFRIYYLYYNNNIISTFQPTSRVNTYTFTNVSLNLVGNNAPLSIVNSATQQTIATFSIPVLYENALSFTTTTLDASGEFEVNGLTNGSTYTIFVQATNARGDSLLYAVASFIPYTIPDPPTNIVLSSLSTSIRVVFSAPVNNGGNAITRYEYSLNTNGPSFTQISINAITNGNTFTISTGLDRTTSYVVYLRAVNDRGNSLSALSTNSVIPYTIPDAPTAVSLVSLSLAIRVSFTPSDNGGNALTRYEYSLNTNGPSFTQVALNSLTNGNTFTINTGLVRSTSYVVYLRAVNDRGNSLSALSTDSVIPYTIPDAPTAVSLVSLALAIRVSFTPSDNGGNAITRYEYSLNADGPSYTSVALNSISANNTFTIATGLDRSTSYVVYLRAVNDRGGSLSALSTNSVIPYTIPDAPVAVSLVSLSTAIQVVFTPPNNGGNAITRYEYSLNSDGPIYERVELNALTNGNTFTIPELNRTTTYSVYLRAINARGNSLSALSTNSVIPYTIPDIPTSIFLTSLSNEIRVIFTPSNGGGNAVSKYEYSLNADGPTYTEVLLSALTTGNTFTISGLSRTTTYSVYLRVINARGNSFSG